jgi:hypothetical protein
MHPNLIRTDLKPWRCAVTCCKAMCRDHEYISNDVKLCVYAQPRPCFAQPDQADANTATWRARRGGVGKQCNSTTAATLLQQIGIPPAKIPAKAMVIIVRIMPGSSARTEFLQNHLSMLLTLFGIQCVCRRVSIACSNGSAKTQCVPRLYRPIYTYIAC